MYAQLQKIYTQIVTILQRTEMKEMLAKQLMTVSISKSPWQATESAADGCRHAAKAVGREATAVGRAGPRLGPCRRPGAR